MIFVGRPIPEWVLEAYVPTGDIRLPLRGDFFWSDIRNAVVEAIEDEASGGGRVILNARKMQPVQQGVLVARPKFRIVKEGETEGGGCVSEVPPDSA